MNNIPAIRSNYDSRFINKHNIFTDIKTCHVVCFVIFEKNISLHVI